MTPGLGRAGIPFISARVAAAPDDSDCCLHAREGLRRLRKTANEKGVIRERTTNRNHSAHQIDLAHCGDRDDVEDVEDER